MSLAVRASEPPVAWVLLWAARASEPLEVVRPEPIDRATVCVPEL
jgi:hypothetical protein